MGPGLLMSIAYLDPGNIAACLQSGTEGKYSLIWTLLWATALGLFYQTMAARIGVVTQRDLAKLSAQQFSTFSRYTLWIAMELAIIGSDIQEVLGSATALNILFGIPIYIGVIITICDSFLFLFIHYWGVRMLEAFFGVLILTMAVTFWINMVDARPDIGELLFGTFVPTVNAHSLDAGIAMFGAVIMPHNLYLHSALVLTRKVDTSQKNKVNEAIFYNNIESAIALVISYFIAMAVVVTFAVYIIEHPEAKKDMDLRQASDALVQLLGESAKYVWAIGLLAAGQSATMTGTYAGQFVMEGFLNWKLPIWARVIITRSVAIVPAVMITFFKTDELTNLDNILNVFQAVLLPFSLIPLLKFVGSPKIMGDFAIPTKPLWFAAIFGFCLYAMNFVLLFEGCVSWSWNTWVLVIVVCIAYMGIQIKALREPVSQLTDQTKEDKDDHEY